MKLSKNFTLAEFSRSGAASKLGISNVIPPKYVPNIKTLVEQVLQPAREVLGLPIMVTSGYRCPALNKAVKGAATSQHLLGEAADIVPVAPQAPLLSPREGEKILLRLFVWIMDNCEFDQLILEHFSSPLGGKEGGPWIHVSYRAGRNRQQVLLC